MNLTALLLAHATETPHKAALIGPRQTLTYAQLRDATSQMASALRAKGLTPGARVLVFVPMSLDLYVVLLGILHLGAVAVFVDPGMGRAELDTALALATPNAFIAIPKAHLLRLVSPHLRAVKIKLRVGRSRLHNLLHGHPTDLPPTPREATAPALLTFTSGSTGQPKGALRSHGFLFAQHRAVTAVMGSAPDDIDMPALPIFILNSLAVGATAVIPPLARQISETDPARLAATLQTHQVTTSAGSPALYAPLAAWARAHHVRFPHLRALFLGGAPVPPNLLDALTPLLPAGEPVVVYGSTEAEPISHISGAEVLRETAAHTSQGQGLCVGRPVDSIQLRLVDDEIWVAGPHVNTRYFNNPEAEKACKVRDNDGVIWHRTGDAGHLDRHGRLWLLGRRASVVTRQARRIYPFSVELAARARSGVTQAALIEISGQVILALEGPGPGHADLVGLDPGIDRVKTVRHIPTDRRHNAKVDYPALGRLLT